MSLISLIRRAAVSVFAVAVLLASPVSAADIDSIYFLIPGGGAGGWDGTARGTGEALTKAGTVEKATYKSMSGGGGGKAIGYLIENADSNHGTLMVKSTPIVIRSLTGVFPHNFRDPTVVAGTIGDYATLVVHTDSSIQSFDQLVEQFKSAPSSVTIGGRSVPGAWITSLRPWPSKLQDKAQPSSST